MLTARFCIISFIAGFQCFSRDCIVPSSHAKRRTTLRPRKAISNCYYLLDFGSHADCSIICFTVANTILFDCVAAAIHLPVPSYTQCVLLSRIISIDSRGLSDNGGSPCAFNLALLHWIFVGWKGGRIKSHFV